MLNFQFVEQDLFVEIYIATEKGNHHTDQNQILVYVLSSLGKNALQAFHQNMLCKVALGQHEKIQRDICDTANMFCGW